MEKIVNSRNHGLVLFDPYIGLLSGATTLGQSRPGSDYNEGVFHIPQSSSITGTSPSDCFVSYRWHSLWEGVPTLLQKCSRCMLQLQPTEENSSEIQRIKTKRKEKKWKKKKMKKRKRKSGWKIKRLCLFFSFFFFFLSFFSFFFWLKVIWSLFVYRFLFPHHCIL